MTKHESVTPEVCPLRMSPQKTEVFMEIITKFGYKLPELIEIVTYLRKWDDHIAFGDYINVMHGPQVNLLWSDLGIVRVERALQQILGLDVFKNTQTAQNYGSLEKTLLDHLKDKGCLTQSLCH